MTKFSMTCSCGETMTMEAEDRKEAVEKFKAMMNEDSIKAHMSQKHPGMPVMTVADCHAQIEKDVVPA